MAKPTPTSDGPKTFRLSPSKLSEFRDNPRAFYLAENFRVTRPRGIVASILDKLDEVIKTRLDEYRAMAQMPPELETLAEMGLSLYPDQRVINKLRQWNSAGTWVDQPLTAPTADAPVDQSFTRCSMIGAIDDLLVEEGTGRLVMIDAKSNASIRDPSYGAHYYGTQLDCYGLIQPGFVHRWEQEFGAKCAFGKPRELADYGFLAFYAPRVILGGAGNGGLTMGWQCGPVKLKVDPDRALKVFRRAIECLRGELPEPGDNERKEWDAYAFSYTSRVKVETLRRQQADQQAQAQQPASATA